MQQFGHRFEEQRAGSCRGKGVVTGQVIAASDILDAKGYLLYETEPSERQGVLLSSVMCCDDMLILDYSIDEIGNTILLSLDGTCRI